MIEINAERVQDFMRLLLITEPHFPAEYWFFRGQSDSRWGLVPASRRELSWERFGGATLLGLNCCDGFVTSSDDELSSVEVRLLDTFGQVLDRVGLAPHLLEDPARVAFAQHIGLPTRLIDWTRSPWTAAYFAAAGAAQRQGDDGRLAVYGMSAEYLAQSQTILGVERLDVGGAGNPNLVAQQGVLLKVIGDRRDLLNGIPIQARSVDYRPTEMDGRDLDTHFLRITLPWAQAGRLLRLLRSQELHAASIYPGHVGVAELVREVFLTAR